MLVAGRAFVFSCFWLGAVAQELTPEQLKKLFAKMDKDQDGSIPVAELKAFAHDMRTHIATNPSTTDPHQKTYFQELDTNGDHMVSLEEALMSAEDGADDHTHHEKAKFYAADKDENGYLTQKEFLAWEWPELDAEVEEAFARSIFESKDKNSDGFLEQKEYFDWFEEPDQVDEQFATEFKSFDKNGDGKLDLAETVAVESGRHEVEKSMESIANHADSNKDGKITLDEFIETKFDLQAAPDVGYLEHWAHVLEL